MAKGGRRVGAGHPKTPTALKIVTGSYRKDRHGNEPQVAASFPAAPVGLNERELATWKELEQHCATWTALSDKWAIWGVVKLVDRLDRNQEAQRASAEAGHPLAFSYKITGSGEDEEKSVRVEAKSNPLIDQEVKLLRELRMFLAICGLSPRDRTQMDVGGSQGDAPKQTTLQRLLKKRA